MNQCQIIGYLGKDPEMRFTASGAAMTTFSCAVTLKWRNQQGEQDEKTEWFQIVCWNKLAETCAQNLNKGRQIYISGRIETRSWDDARSGEKRYRTELIAEKVLFLGPNNGANNGSRREESDMDFEPESIPFS